MIQNDDAVYLPSLTVAYRKIGGSVVLVNLKDNAMIRLNETGSLIWSMMNGSSVGEIAIEVSAQFDVSEVESLQDTREFMQLLLGRGLIAEKSNQ
jgi:hypothetical protein